MSTSRVVPLAVAGLTRPVLVHGDRPTERPRGVVLLHHGFSRGPRALDRLTAGLVASGLAVVRPAVSAWRRGRTYNDPGFLTALALGLGTALEAARDGAGPLRELAIGPTDRRPVPPPRNAAAGQVGPPLVLAGHSAGAAAALHEAAVLLHRGGLTPAGLLLLDPTDSLAAVGTRALPDLDDVPVLVVAGPPGRCNRGGALVAALADRRAGFLGARLLHGGHGDAEGKVSPLYRAACGDRTAAEDVALVHRLAAVWAADLAAGAATPALRPGGAVFDAWTAADRVLAVLGTSPS